MRFAAQRLLAELPITRISDQVVDQLAEAAMAIDRGRTLGRYIGEPVEGQQLLMQLRPAGIQLPFDGADAAELAVQQIPRQVAGFLAEPPAQVRELVFGWVPESGLSAGVPRKMGYEQGPAAPADAAAQLRAASAELMAAGGMVPGDVVVNMPYGINQGDYKRAKAYMRQGFGAANSIGEQMARVGRDGQLVPEQILSVHPGLAQDMRWLVA